MLLLPGSALSAELAYGVLLEALGGTVDAHPKELEMCPTETPPSGYSLGSEVARVIDNADWLGWQRFHLVGHSGALRVRGRGRPPERLLSLALLEPAFAGNWNLSPVERELWQQRARAAAA